MEHSKRGTYIIVFAVLSALNLISLIGGIIAITYSPLPAQTATQPYSYPQSTLPSATKYCSNYGAAVNQTDIFCYRCGSQL